MVRSQLPGRTEKNQREKKTYLNGISNPSLASLTVTEYIGIKNVMYVDLI